MWKIRGKPKEVIIKPRELKKIRRGLAKVDALKKALGMKMASAESDTGYVVCPLCGATVKKLTKEGYCKVCRLLVEALGVSNLDLGRGISAS